VTKLGHFINFNPKEFGQETAAELQPRLKPKRNRPLTAPEEWTGYEIEKELKIFPSQQKIRTTDSSS